MKIISRNRLKQPDVKEGKGCHTSPVDRKEKHWHLIKTLILLALRGRELGAQKPAHITLGHLTLPTRGRHEFHIHFPQGTPYTASSAHGNVSLCLFPLLSFSSLH